MMALLNSTVRDPKKEMNKDSVKSTNNKRLSTNTFEPIFLELKIKYLQLETDYLIVTLLVLFHAWLKSTSVLLA